MEAIIKQGKGQFKVKTGDTILVDKLALGETKKLVLDQVLMITDGDKTVIGTPYVPNATVSATIVREEVKGEKVIHFRYKAKKGYHRKKGHRQQYTEIKIGKIEVA